MISEKLLVFLTSWIIENTEFSKKIDAPQFFALSQTEMSQKACFSSDNCKVKAYYAAQFTGHNIGLPVSISAQIFG